MRYIYQEVEKTPESLESGVVYVNKEFELASLLCACGCGHKIVLLYPDGHTVDNNAGFATVRPSVGAWDAACKSHYFITNGNVEWCRSWSDSTIKSAMLAQRARHVEATKPGRWNRIYRAIIGWLFK